MPQLLLLIATSMWMQPQLKHQRNAKREQQWTRNTKKVFATPFSIVLECSNDHLWSPRGYHRPRRPSLPLLWHVHTMDVLTYIAVNCFTFKINLPLNSFVPVNDIFRLGNRPDLNLRWCGEQLSTVCHLRTAIQNPESMEACNSVHLNHRRLKLLCWYLNI